MKNIDHWIGGSAVPGSGSLPVWNPATGRERGRVALGGHTEVGAAVRAAAKAFPAWSESSLAHRARILFAFRELLMRHSEELAGLVSAEHGKVMDDARAEVARGREIVEYACGIAGLLKGGHSDQVSHGVDVHAYRQPIGVCAGITPFNFPVMVPMWMHPIAIACGNTFVLKPSERDPSASMLVARLYAEAGLPAGVFNVVNGAREAVNALLDHPEVAAVSFVGSTPVARHVHARATAAGKRVQALGGAKNHAVVLPDADLEFAADQLVAGAYGSAGQRCMAVSVAVAVGAAADPLVALLERRARTIKVGPGDAPDSEMGPLVTVEAKDRVAAAVAKASAQGAAVVVDGRGLKIDGHEDGFFLGPSLLDGVTAAMEAYREELFGPVLAVVRVPTLGAAIDLVNANPYGNGAVLFTADGGAARRFQRSVRAGMVGINVPVPVPVAAYSFGGWKDSLIGDSPIHGEEGVRFYTRPKVVTTRWPDHDRRPAAAVLAFPTAD